MLGKNIFTNKYFYKNIYTSKYFPFLRLKNLFKRAGKSILISSLTTWKMYSPIRAKNTQVSTFSAEKAKATRKYCMDCSCPGFPYCFSRVFPKKHLTSIQMKKRVTAGERICQNCGCTSCLYKKLDMWSECKFCCQWYMSDLHCR